VSGSIVDFLPADLSMMFDPVGCSLQRETNLPEPMEFTTSHALVRDLEPQMNESFYSVGQSRLESRACRQSTVPKRNASANHSRLTEFSESQLNGQSSFSF
jgi:hypothetical protein